MIFSSEKVNTGRQIEVDLLKAFTVVFSMIIIHVWDYDTTGFETTFTWFLDDVFGGIFAAPMFMFCMGIGMEYSRNSDPKQMAIRGLRLLTIGQVLNFFRYELIIGLQAIVSGDPAYISGLALNLSSDIMQFAGLSFILMGLFKKLSISRWLILAISIVMSICGTLLEHVQTGCYAFDQILGFFWGTDTESFFPLFNWFIFIAGGRCFGSLYQKIQNKTAFFLIAAPIGVASFALMWYLQKHTGSTFFNSFDDSYHGFCWMRLPDALSVILMAPTVLGLFYLFSRLLPQKVCEVLSHPSKHINQYYCVSWWWIMVFHLWIWCDRTEALLSIWLNILTFTIISVTLYNDYLKENVEAFCSKHRVILTTLVWVVTVGAAFIAFTICPELPNQFNGYLLH